MVHTIHLDTRHGLTLEAFVAAVVDLGVAPSPILFAAGSLGLDGELRFEREEGGTRVTLTPGPSAATRSFPHAARLLETSGLPPETSAHALALLRATAGARAAAEQLPVERVQVPDVAARDSLLMVAAAGHALACVGPAAWRVTRINVGSTLPTGPLAELLDAYADLLDFDDPSAGVTLGGAALLARVAPPPACGRPDPEWRGFAARGRGLDAPGVPPLVIAIGEAP